MIDGIEIAVNQEAVVVTASEPLTVLSSAFVRGGFTAARAIVNLHVPKDLREDQADDLLPRVAAARGIPVTEVKTAMLAAAEIRCEDGHVASGTSTDAVVIAATGRGTHCRFGGPISDLGSVVARAARAALGAGIQRWLDEHP